MSVGTARSTALHAFEASNRIPIAKLNPSADNVDHPYVEANVALIWPYSSSSQLLSLLLAEKDIRLRKSKGQVKVTFHGDCAREVAKTQVGIGDSVKLGLQDARWSRTGDQVATPGKKVDWDIDFDKRIQLEVEHGNGVTAVIHFIAQPPPVTAAKSSIVEIDGPKTNGFIDVRTTGLLGPHFSPARRATNRISSGSFIDASLDPFADDDGYIVGRGRKRTKFARHSGSWQLLDSEQHAEKSQEQTLSSSPLQRQRVEIVLPAPSPDKEDSEVITRKASTGSPEVEKNNIATAISTQQLDYIAPGDVVTAINPQDEGLAIVEGSPVLMGPPPIPLPATERMHISDLRHVETQQPMTPTPVLRPLPSPGLALVSPLIERHGSAVGYFPLMPDLQPGLNANSRQSPELEEVLGSVPIDPQLEMTTDRAIGRTFIVKETEANVDMQGIYELDRHIDGIHEASQPLQINSQEIPSSSPPLVVNDELLSSVLEAVGAESATQGGVDLDALQEQIDESNQNLQDFASNQNQNQSEDEDMYGPPVGIHTVSAVAEASEEIASDSNVTGESSSASSPSSSRPESSSAQRALQSSSNRFAMSESDKVDDRLQTIQSAVVIDSSTDEERDESDTGSESSSSDDDDETNVLDTEVDLEKELETELAEDEQLESESGNSAESDHSITEMETGTKLSAFGDAGIPAQPELSASDTTEPSQNSHITERIQSDGSSEFYESESDRAQLRAEVPNAESHVALDPGVLLSEVMEYVPDDALGSSGPDTIEKNVLTMIKEKEDDETLIPQVVAVSRQPHLVATATASSPEEPDIPITKELTPYEVPSFMTPNPTQNSLSFAESMPYAGTKTHFELPPTPKLTQDIEESTLVTSPVTETPMPQSQSADAAILKVSDQNLKQLPRSSQRLSRKSFTSGKISTEYFTPRRSARNINSSPVLGAKTFATVQQTTSPDASEKSMGSQMPNISSPDDTPKTPTLSRGTKTPLSYYPHLSTIQDYWSLQVDVLAVCTAESGPPEKAKSGPKDFYTTLHLADPSFEDVTTVRAEIFRPRKTALPSSKRGDVLLLRNMKVQTYDHKFMLLSTESSAWAVFEPVNNKDFDVAVKGPPIEYDKHEKEEAERLLKWWSDVGEERYVDMPTTAERDEDVEAARPTSSRMTRSQRRKLNTTDHFENSFESSQATAVPASITGSQASRGSKEPSSPVATTDMSHPPSSPPVPVKRRGHRRGNSERSESIVHELRDGTTYVDEDSRRRSVSIAHELRDGRIYFDD